MKKFSRGIQKNIKLFIVLMLHSALISACTAQNLDLNSQSPQFETVTPSVPLDTATPFLTKTAVPTQTASPVPTATCTPTMPPQAVEIKPHNIESLQLVREVSLYPNGLLMDAFWSPDGSQILVITNRFLQVLEIDTLEVLFEDTHYQSIQFMDDGTLLLMDTNQDLYFLKAKENEISPFKYGSQDETAHCVEGICGVSPDGRYFVQASEPNILTIFDRDTQETINMEYIQNEYLTIEPYSVMFAPDSNQLFLLAKSKASTILFSFDVAGQTTPYQAKVPGWVSPYFSPDGEKMALETNKFVTLYNSINFAEWSNHSYGFGSKLENNLYATYYGKAFSFLKDSNKLGILYRGDIPDPVDKFSKSTGSILIYNTSTGNIENTIDDLPAESFDFSFSLDGEKFFTLSSDGAVRVWNTADGSLVNERKAYDPSYVVSVSPDTKLLAFPILGGVRIVSSETGETVTEIRPYSNMINTNVSFNGNEKISIGYSRYPDSTLSKTFSIETGEFIKTYYDLSNCTFTDNEAIMICEDKNLQLFDANVGRTLLQFTPPQRDMFWQAQYNLAVSEDSQYTAYCVFGSETIFLWETFGGKQVRNIHDANKKICGRLAFDETGKLLISSLGSIWSIPDGELVLNFIQSKPVFEPARSTARISSQNNLFLIYPDIYDLSNGEYLNSFPDVNQNINKIMFLNEGKEIGVINNTSIQYWAVME